jgi:hypothetical protein
VKIYKYGYFVVTKVLIGKIIRISVKICLYNYDVVIRVASN